MVERLRAAEEAAAEEQRAAGPVVRPPAAGNMATAGRLGSGDAAALGRDDVADLGGLAGNRAVVQFIGGGSGSGTPQAGPTPLPGGPAPGPTQQGPTRQGQAPGPAQQGPAPGPAQQGPAPGPAQQGPAPGQTPAPPQGQKTTQPPTKAAAPPPVAVTVEPPPPIDWIASLPEHIQKQIDSLGAAGFAKANAGDKAYSDARAKNRTTFMHTMRWLMGKNNDAAIQQHFQDIKPMDVNGGKGDDSQLWAHVSTRERLLEVKAELEAQGQPMPQTTVGLGMRGDHLHTAGKGPGWYTHACGFAVDWRAYPNPRIADPKLITLIDVVTGGTPDMRTSVVQNQRVDLVIKIGQGTADPAEKKKLFDSIESEYKRLTEASEKFKTDLPKDTLDRLREVEKARGPAVAAGERLAQLKKNKAAKDKIEAAQKAFDDAQKPFEKLRDALIADLAKLFEPWIKKIDERIAVIDKHAKDAGVDLDVLTGQFGFQERKANIDTLTRTERTITSAATADVATVLQLHRDALAIKARIDAARAGLADPDQFSSDLDETEKTTDAVLTGLDPLQEALGGILPKAKFEIKPTAPLKAGKVSQQTITALKADAGKLGPRFNKVAVRVLPSAVSFDETEAGLTEAKDDYAKRQAYRAEKVKALGAGKVEELLAEKIQLINLKGAKDGLLTNAGDFLIATKLESGNPSVDQLLGVMPESKGGFFTPDPDGGEKDAEAGRWSGSHGFNLAFIKAMVNHGFELGMAWKGGSDPMHFELAEGRKYLTSAGTEPVQAGAVLRVVEGLTDW